MELDIKNLRLLVDKLEKHIQNSEKFKRSLSNPDFYCGDEVDSHGHDKCIGQCEGCNDAVFIDPELKEKIFDKADIKIVHTESDGKPVVITLTTQEYLTYNATGIMPDRYKHLTSMNNIKIEDACNPSEEAPDAAESANSGTTSNSSVNKGWLSSKQIIDLNDNPIFIDKKLNAIYEIIKDKLEKDLAKAFKEFNEKNPTVLPKDINVVEEFLTENEILSKRAKAIFDHDSQLTHKQRMATDPTYRFKHDNSHLKDKEFVPMTDDKLNEENNEQYQDR